jgi:hypothetical protein
MNESLIEIWIVAFKLTTSSYSYHPAKIILICFPKHLWELNNLKVVENFM